MSPDERGTGPPGPGDGEGGPKPANVEESPHSTNTTSHRQAAGCCHSNGSTPRAVSSQQVSWWTVHEHVAPVLAPVESWPMAGTPEWCALDDDDPAKTAALLDAAQHWALRVETLQEAHCEASRAIAGALDWSALAREINQRTDFYAARPYLRRVAS